MALTISEVPERQYNDGGLVLLAMGTTDRGGP
jgi:hypothetical protein